MRVSIFDNILIIPENNAFLFEESFLVLLESIIADNRVDITHILCLHQSSQTNIINENSCEVCMVKYVTDILISQSIVKGNCC